MIKNKINEKTKRNNENLRLSRGLNKKNIIFCYLYFLCYSAGLLSVQSCDKPNKTETAISVRKILGPSDTKENPFDSKSKTSSSSQPPSGPTATTIFFLVFSLVFLLFSLFLCVSNLLLIKSS